MLLGQGESDTLFNVNEAVANYYEGKARGVPVKMIWHSNGHGYDDQPGEGDVFGNDQTNLGAQYIPQRLLAWFDRYLRMDTSVDTGPEFAYFRDWVPYDQHGSATPAYGTAPAFPAEPSLTFTLSGAGDLVGPGSTAAGGSDIVLSPAKGQPAAYTETSNFQCPTCSVPGPPNNLNFSSVPPTNIPGQFADFTSGPFLRDVASVGIPTAHVHISNLLGGDVILFGKVWDVDPGGNASLIKRLIAPIRVFNPGQPVDMTLVGLAHLFPKGHSVRFELATTDLTSTSDHLAPDTITLTQSPSAGPTSGIGRVVNALFPAAEAATDLSTFTLPVDGTTSNVVNPTRPSTGPGSSSPGGGLPNTGAAPVGPAVVAVILALGAMVVVRARRRAR
jgi:ABC-2 type transport system ATP-binding protein